MIFYMMTAWAIWHSTQSGPRINKKVEHYIIEFAKFPMTFYNYFFTANFQDDRFIKNDIVKSGANYFVDTSKIDNGYLLISTFDSNKNAEIKLYNFKKNITIKKWTLNKKYILANCPENINERNIELVHPLLLKDSSIITHFGYLLRINKSNNVMWINKEASLFHHSIELENDTLLWTGGHLLDKKYFNFESDSLLDNSLVSINTNTGKILQKISVADILIRNGYKDLFEIGPWEEDAIHLNDIQPALKNSKFWQKGDLLISIRNRNTIFLYRKNTNKIIWLKTGPWLNQHDCDFIDDKRIMVFGNDILRGKDHHLIYGHNNIYIYNLENNTIDTSYSPIMRKIGIKTLNEGRCELLDNGDMFVDESNFGNLYIFNKEKLKFHYTERVDKKNVKKFFWVRYIPEK